MSKYIARRRGILGGTPCIRGTRVPVSRILFLLAKGKDVLHIVCKDYPFLSVQEVSGMLMEISSKYQPKYSAKEASDAKEK